MVPRKGSCCFVLVWRVLFDFISFHFFWLFQEVISLFFLSAVPFLRQQPLEPISFWKRGYQGGIPGLPIWMEADYLMNDLKIVEGEDLISFCWGRFLADRLMAPSLTCPWFSGKSSLPEGLYFFRRWKDGFPQDRHYLSWRKYYFFELL